ncbi:Ferric reduction oxidase 8 [Rhynchospora pubera]|uniref:Ferric reduction oxidase 8 n=1 Tax=Rhynchospora pubera TaxID=906938 RepID=A0AAV8HVM0_9POAL|nr:Ferric reduction oxidase 8 [Rhynchospora pubera]
MAQNSARLLALKLSMGILVAAWISFWILKPTKTWKKAWHSAEDLANDTFLRDSGLNVVVFCFPVVGFAILSFIYLHSSEKEKIRSKTSLTTHFRVTFSKPVILKSPIGVISLGELSGAMLFVAFLFWTYYSNVSSDFKKLAPCPPLKLSRQQLKVMHMGVRVGSLSEICLAVLLFPILRGMSLLRVFGIEFEAAVRYHTWIANALVLFCTLHGTIIMSIWGQKKRLLAEITSWPKIGRVNVAGAISLISILIIWISSLPVIRRKYFRTFYITHHLYIVFISFFLLHAGDKHFYLVLSGVLLFALDKILRLIQSRRETCIVSAHVLPCRAVELILPKDPGMKYSPMSTIFLKIPSISRFEWHPFSITSSCYKNEEHLSVLIKSQGQWTSELYSKISSIKDEEFGQLKSLSTVGVDGPYGPEHLLHQRYYNLVLIAGGSGITPFMSILNETSSKDSTTNWHPTNIVLIYCVKQVQDISMLTPILPILCQPTAEITNFRLKIFVTQEQGSTMTAFEVLNKPPQVIKMLPSTTKRSVGITQEGLIWRAIIVALAFVIFLISMVLLSDIFVHQVHGKPSRKSNPSWINDLLLFAAFVIAMSCSAVASITFAQRKLRNDRRAMEIPKKVIEEPMGTTDKKSGFLFEPEIYLGKRPNLSDVLSDLTNKIRDESIGVFVCGPDSMKVSVASFCKNHTKISCKNGLSRSVHFHSVNFSL